MWQNSEVHSYLRDLLQLILIAVGVLGGLVAAFKALIEIARSRHLSEREFRFRKASEGKKLVDEFLADPLAKEACRLLDWSGRTFKVSDIKFQEIHRDDLLRALRPQVLERRTEGFDEMEVFVRDAFDCLFERIERYEHFLESGLTDFQDVKRPVEYYVKKMSEEKQTFESYLRTFEYWEAIKFLQRFTCWNEK